MNIDRDFSFYPKAKINIEEMMLKTEGNGSQMNRFKNPYKITFFNQSLAKKYFDVNNTTTKRLKERTTRTPIAKLAYESKLLNDKERLQSKTPILSKINMINKPVINQRRCDSRKENGMRLESKSISQNKTKPSFHPRAAQTHLAQTTRNNESKNSIRKENTITGISIKTVSKKKMINLKETNNNNMNTKTNTCYNPNIINADLLSNDIRMKMLISNNNHIIDKPINNDYKLIKESKDKEKIKPKIIHHFPTQGTFRNNNKMKLVDDLLTTDNKKSNNDSMHYQSMLKCNLKNQYHELIDLYLISEEV